MPLVLVANRAPIRRTPGGWAPGLGGLASALLPVVERRGGAWVSMQAPAEATPLVQRYPEAAPTMTVRRIPLSAAEHAAYYEGMANRVLWPLSHYLIEQVEPDRGFRDAYRAVNRRFAHAALDVARETDAAGEPVQFWIQDYHLMLVPEMIRAGRPDARIGHFWHIPWPAPEVFRVLPSSRALLRGMLGADLVGFHTDGDAENFREAARDLLDAEIDGRAVLWEGRRVVAEAHPIGIDVARFEAFGADPEGAAEAARLRDELAVERLVLGVDRLDYTKGLLLRFGAYERFLDAHPEWHGRVTLFQVATPSRTGVPAYARLKRAVDEAVGRINGRFSEGVWQPIRYRYRAYTQRELAVLYRAADVAFVTPLRDGMNLVAHEFAAVSAAAEAAGEGTALAAAREPARRPSGAPGVLVLSELAGAADYLDGALLANPYDADGLADALHSALSLSAADASERLGRIRDAVRRLDAHRWAATFLDALGMRDEG